MSESFATADCYTDAFARGLQPDPDQTVSEWADENFELPIGLSSEPGKWRTARTPYLKEVLDNLSPSSPVEETRVMKAAQLGFTTAGIIWAGFIVDRAPGPMLLVEPTLDVATKLSKLKVKPMLEAVPCLQGKVKEARQRDSGNTVLMKEFTGGVLVMTGSNSAVGLRFIPVRYLMLDEEDAYVLDVDGEGQPSELGKKRTTTFSNRKIFRLSSPLEKHTSVIEPGYRAGSRARFHVPCPICLKVQHLRWGQLTFTFDGKKDPARTAYQCEHCQHLIPESQKTWMLENGKWVHEEPANPIKSYHINALYAPYGWKPASWPVLAEEWLEAQADLDRGDKRKHKVFINTRLAETWEEKGEHIEHSELYNRREAYPADVPAGALLLTAAVDVQDDRLEAECAGVGLGEETWSVDYQRWMGSPAKQDVWDQLDLWWKKTWTHESGVAMKIRIMVVDIGGHHAKEAYEFVRARQAQGVFAIKGSNQAGAQLVKMGTKDNLGKVRLFMVGTDAAKDTLFGRLQLETPGPGYCHFPERAAYDEEYFLQLTAEEKREKYDRGVLTGFYYKKIRARNEALDLKVYNMAALAILNPDLVQLAVLGVQAAPAPQAAGPGRKGGWVTRQPPPEGSGRGRGSGWFRRR
jgi:phage terminase large subunit GpA-like protein